MLHGENLVLVNNLCFVHEVLTSATKLPVAFGKNVVLIARLQNSKYSLTTLYKNISGAGDGEIKRFLHFLTFKKKRPNDCYPG